MMLVRYRQQEQSQNQEEKMAEMQKRSTPSSNADFARLYNELDTWRRTEVAKVKVSLPGRHVGGLSDLLTSC